MGQEGRGPWQCCLHKGNRNANTDAIVGYAGPGIPFITMVDHQCGYSEADPDCTFQDVGHKVEER